MEQKPEEKTCICKFEEGTEPSGFRKNKIINMYIGVIVSPPSHLGIALFSFLAGYIGYGGSVDAGLRMIAYVYITLLLLLIQSSPMIGIVFSVIFLVYLENLYAFILAIIGLSDTLLTGWIMIIAIAIGTLLAIITMTLSIEILKRIFTQMHLSGINKKKI